MICFVIMNTDQGLCSQHIRKFLPSRHLTLPRLFPQYESFLFLINLPFACDEIDLGRRNNPSPVSKFIPKPKYEKQRYREVRPRSKAVKNVENVNVNTLT